MANIIELTDDVELGKSSLETYLPGIDLANQIASVGYSSSNVRYTATQDCYLVAARLYGSSRQPLYLDDILIFSMPGVDGSNGQMFIPMCKGQTVKYNGGDGRWNGAQYNIYGLKKTS